MRHLQRCIVVLFASGLLMWALPVEAQVTMATLVGQLRDSSGAVIPGATVVATHEGTGVARETRTDVGLQDVRELPVTQTGDPAVLRRQHALDDLDQRGDRERRF